MRSVGFLYWSKILSMYSSGPKFLTSAALPRFKPAPLFKAVRSGIISPVRKRLLLRDGVGEGYRGCRGGVGGSGGRIRE